MYCFDSIYSKLDKKHVVKIQKIPESWGESKCPLFVTWKKGKELKLRGCIGTFSDQTELKTNLFQYARTSAFGDYRFSPVKISEVSSLHCGVSLLINFEKVSRLF